MAEPATQRVIVSAAVSAASTRRSSSTTLAARPDVEITLVNRDNFFLFTPMLHEVAASDLDITHIVNPVRKLLKHVRFFDGDVEHIDLERRASRVHGSPRTGTPRARLRPPGARARLDHELFRLPGLEERAITMKSLGDAIACATG